MVYKVHVRNAYTVSAVIPQLCDAVLIRCGVCKSVLSAGYDVEAEICFVISYT